LRYTTPCAPFARCFCALAGVGQHNNASLRFVGSLYDGSEVTIKPRSHNQNSGAEFIERHEHLFRRLCLGHDTHLVLNGEHFRDAGSEDCLVIGQNQFEHVLKAPRKSGL
jgi:hypothetical protein